MGQTLLFVAGLAALLSLVPLLVLLATGRWSAAMHAGRQYGWMVGVVAAVMAAGALVGLIGAALSS